MTRSPSSDWMAGLEGKDLRVGKGSGTSGERERNTENGLEIVVNKDLQGNVQYETCASGMHFV